MQNANHLVFELMTVELAVQHLRPYTAQFTQRDKVNWDAFSFLDRVLILVHKNTQIKNIFLIPVSLYKIMLIKLANLCHPVSQILACFLFFTVLEAVLNPFYICDMQNIKYILDKRKNMFIFTIWVPFRSLRKIFWHWILRHTRTNSSAYVVWRRMDVTASAPYHWWVCKWRTVTPDRRQSTDEWGVVFETVAKKGRKNKIKTKKGRKDKISTLARQIIKLEEKLY